MCRSVTNCGWVDAIDKCDEKHIICKRHQFSRTECIRYGSSSLVQVAGQFKKPDIYYVYAGVVCSLHHRWDLLARQQEAAKNCRVEQTILAVNLGRNMAHVDRHGIRFMAENETLWKDPQGSRITDVSPHLLGVDKTEQNLYRFHIWGDGSKSKPGSCIEYDVHLYRDGDYELSIKMIDNYWRRSGSRVRLD